MSEAEEMFFASEKQLIVEDCGGCKDSFPECALRNDIEGRAGFYDRDDSVIRCEVGKTVRGKE